jgi:hypothetical protein
MPPRGGGRSVAPVSDGDQEGTMAATEQRSARGGEYIEAGGPEMKAMMEGLSRGPAADVARALRGGVA